MSYNELKQHGTPEFPIELYHIDKNHPKYEMAHHWHSNIEIIRVLQGSLRITLNNRELNATEGDIIIVNTEVVHGGTPENCVYECIVFNPDLLRISDTDNLAFLDDLNQKNIVINDFFRKNETRVSEITNQLFSAMENNISSFHIISYLYMLFAEITENKYYKRISELSNENDKQNAKLKKVLSYIRSSYEAQITLDDIAKEAGMSRKYFCRFLKEMTQKTPINYLNTYRIEHAARKLISTDEPITNIAFECGFNDLSYFIKTFKNIKGVTPKNFRVMNDY